MLKPFSALLSPLFNYVLENSSKHDPCFVLALLEAQDKPKSIFNHFFEADKKVEGEEDPRMEAGL